MYEAQLGSLLLAEQELVKHEALELGVLLTLPLVLALALLWITSKRVANGAPAWQRWSSLIPLFVGIWRAWVPFSSIRDEFYLDYTNLSDRSEMLHYAVMIVPCVAALGMIAYLLYLRHRERMER